MRACLAMVVLLACTCEAHYGEPTCGDKWGDGTDIAVTTADCGVGLVAREDAADVTCAESPCDPGSSSSTLGSCCESPTTATCGDVVGDGSFVAVTTSDCGDGFARRRDAGDVQCEAAPCDVQNSLVDHDLCCEVPRCMNAAALRKLFKTTGIVDYSTNYCVDELDAPTDPDDVDDSEVQFIITVSEVPSDAELILIENTLATALDLDDSVNVEAVVLTTKTAQVQVSMRPMELSKAEDVADAVDTKEEVDAIFQGVTGLNNVEVQGVSTPCANVIGRSIVDAATGQCIPAPDDLDTDVMTDADIDSVDKAVDWDFPEQEAATKSVTCAPIHVTADGQGVASAHCDGGHAADEPLCVFECPMGFVVTGANPIFCDPNTGKWPAFPKCVSLWDDELEV